MSTRNTPNINKNVKTAPVSASKFLTPSTTTPIKPARATLSTSKKLPLATRPGLIKQTSACDLRERLRLTDNDDVFNTAFSSTPPISKLGKYTTKSKSTMASSVASGSATSLTKTSLDFVPHRTPAKKLFGSSSLFDGVNRTPECFTKVSLDAMTPQHAYKNAEKYDESSNAGKVKGASEISNLTVAVRVRPMNAKECTAQSVINVISVENNEVRVFAGTNADSSAGVSYSFQYDYVFSSYDSDDVNFANQETIFKETTLPLIDKAFEGYNVCLFGYGQTGSGKTYCMMGIDSGKYHFTGTGKRCSAMGKDSDDDDDTSNCEAGIIPRVCDDLFGRLNTEKYSAEVEVSYFEIYNEKIHDLLAVTPTHTTSQTPINNQQKRAALRIREHPRWGPYVEDLSSHPVDSSIALKNWLAVGNSQRATAATGMNDRSSRSHSIFTINLTLTETDVESSKLVTKRSRISLVDLAGSERVSQTRASGERLKEGVSINQSLLTLGKVIAALADTKRGGSNFVPYRESVLTRLLQESLGGNSKTVMLATISPASLHLDETLATLRYARSARSIVNRVKVNEDPNDREVHKLRTEVDCLRAQVQFYKRQEIHAIEAAPRKIIIETVDATAGDEEEKEKLRQQLRDKERELARAQTAWEERIRDADHKCRNEMKLLQQNGLALQLSVAQKQPCLVNLATDPMLSGTLLYILPPGIVRIGRKKPSTHVQCDIVLDGPLVGMNHCKIDNRKGRLFIQPDSFECETFVNGELIQEQRQIYHGDRIVIGGLHYFRVSNPDCPRRSQNEIVDYQTAHQEVLREQEKRLRLELLAEKRAAIQQIEEERTQNELNYNEKVAQLELEQFKYKCSQELMDIEKEIMARDQNNESIFEYKPFESDLLEQIRRTMEKPSEESLHETQLKVKEATQRVKDLGLNYEFVQAQVADEFGLFKAVVKILDKENNRYAEWPTARLTVWLDLIRANCDVTAENVFHSVDIQWLEVEEEIDVNESLNSSRISLNLSAMKDALLGKPMRSRFEALRSRFSPWSDKKRLTNQNTESPQSPNVPIERTKRGIFTENVVLDDTLGGDDDVKKNISEKTSTPTPAIESFDQQAQQCLRDLRKSTLTMKKLFADRCKNENCSAEEQNSADQIVSMLEKVEHLSHDIRHLVKNTHGKATPGKATKTVRFAFDVE